jgi:hypothetical protein
VRSIASPGRAWAELEDKDGGIDLTSKSMTLRPVASPGRAWAEMENGDGGSEGGTASWGIPPAIATRFRRTPVKAFIDGGLSQISCHMNSFEPAAVANRRLECNS